MTTTRERPVRSTRARAPLQEPPRRSTRSTRSTRAQPAHQPPPREAPVRSSAPRRIIRTEAVPQTPSRASTRKPAQSTRRILRTEPEAVSRTEVFTEKRLQAKYLAPAQFLLVLFGVVVVSVFAFGLLRDDPETAATEPADPNEVIEVDSTSTNTGILRGGGD